MYYARDVVGRYSQHDIIKFIDDHHTKRFNLDHQTSVDVIIIIIYCIYLNIQPYKKRAVRYADGV